MLFSFLAVAFVVACACYVYFHFNDFYSVFEASKFELALASLFILCSFLATCYQLDLFLKRFNLVLGKLELLAITHAMMLGNLVIPMRGGSGALALYLKKVHCLDFTAFAVIYGGTAILVALMSSFFALIALVSLWILHGYNQFVLIGPVFVLFVLCLYLTVRAPSFGPRKNFLMDRIVHVANSWKIIISDTRLVFCLSIAIALMSLALIGSFFHIYRAIGSPLTLEATVITSSIGSIVNLAPLTPGSLGVFDVAIIEIQRIMGLTAAKSIAAAIIFRVLTFCLASLLGIPSIVYIYARLKKAGA